MASAWLTRLKRLTKDQRNLLVPILGLSTLVAVEACIGAIKFDVLVISDALQASLHAGALIASFAAIDLSMLPCDEIFSYGYERAEVLAAFGSCALVIFDCVLGVAHGVQDALMSSLGVHVSETPDMASLMSRLASVRCGLDLLGLALFWQEAKALSRRARKQSTATLAGHAENLSAVVLKLFAQAVLFLATRLCDLGRPLLGSLELPLSLLAALVLVYVAVPSLVRTTRLLMLQVPSEVRPQLDKCLREVSFTDGVLEVLRWSFWPATDGSGLIGTVCVRVHADADGDAVLRSVQATCARISRDLTVQVLHEQRLDSLLATRGSMARVEGVDRGQAVV